MRNIMILVAMIAFSTTAQAAGPGAGDVSDACRAEVMTLCPKTDDRQARRACIMEKRAQISEGCRGELKAARESRRAGKAGQQATTVPTPEK
jgi:hypothetical protein